MLECQGKIPFRVLIFFLWASSINLVKFLVSLMENWGVWFMTLFFFENIE